MCSRSCESRGEFESFKAGNAGVDGVVAEVPASVADEDAAGWLPVVGFAMAIVAVVLGGVGLSRANLGGGGRGQAIAGLVLGVVGIALPILVLSALFSFSRHIQEIRPSFGP